MKKVSILIAVIFISHLFSSCIFTGTLEGNGNVVEETREVEDFNQIGVSRGMNVYIMQGTPIKVVVKADENLLPAIETDVDGEMLTVTTNKWIRKSKSLRVFVTVPDLDMIKTSSGSNVFAEDTLHFKTLAIKSSAGSNVKIPVNSGDLDISATSGSNIFLNGIAKNVNIKTNSGSNIKAGDLQTGSCTAKASSGANIWINVQNELSVKVSSGSNFFYSGEPNSSNVEKSSGGNVIKQ